MITTAEDEGPTVAVQLRVKTPTLPNYVEVQGIGHRTLDEAQAAAGKGLVLDVGRLDDEGVESLITQWASAFRAHAKARRTA
jgi:hypothetical protein